MFSSTPSGLQNQLNNLQEASDTLNLTVNLDKSKIIVFRKGGHLSKTEHWYYKGREVSVVNSYKYLGFILSTGMAFDAALDDYVRRAKKKVTDIFRTMWSLGNIDMSIFFKLFDCQVKPMLLYAAEIWGLTKFQSIESVHLFACKRLLSVSPKSPNTMIYGETGRYPLSIDSALRSIKYWFKLQQMSNTRFPKQAQQMIMEKIPELSRGRDNYHNWSFSVKRCFDFYGFSEVWINGGVGNEILF